MRTPRWLVAGLGCLLLASPAIARAQTQQKEADDFVRDVLKAIFGPNWNVFAHGGVTTGGRYLIQDVVVPAVGQRSLKSAPGFNVGLGGGVDILMQTGFRFSYTYGQSDLNFRTDDGTGSDALDLDDVGTLRHNSIGIEVMRFMLPHRAKINPYGSVGLVSTWWTLRDESVLIDPAGGSTQYRFGGLATFGLRYNITDHWSMNLEGASASVRNPFTGKHSFRVTTGATIDEPSRVGRTDFRISGMYRFGYPEMPKPPQTRAGRVKR